MSAMEHAILSPSSSNKWLNCTPSARLEEKEGIKNIKTYTTEGQVAHRLAELHILKEVKKQEIKQEELNEIKNNKLYSKDMEDNINIYLNKISDIIEKHKNKNIICQVEVEKRVDFNEYVPCSFGTIDCLIIANKVAYVIDLKYGIGEKVEVKDNTQLKLYALGVLKEYDYINKICLAIIQPRLNNINNYILTKEDLISWGESIKEPAKKAWEGEGEQKIGGYCKFCKIKAICKKRVDEVVNIETKDKYLIDKEELGEYLEKALNLRKWCDDIIEYATEYLIEGGEIEGFNLRHARGTRAFIDKDKAIKRLLDSGVKKEDIYETKEKSLAQIEKNIGKKDFKELLGDLVYTKEGKLTINKIEKD